MTQIVKHFTQMPRCRHRLVADHVRGQRHHIERIVVLQRGFGTTPCAKKRALELVVIIHAFGDVDEYLLHARTACVGHRGRTHRR